jgi:RNA polymerase sigma factor (sigma-70 family)
MEYVLDQNLENQNSKASEIVERERGKLFKFIRSRVSGDAEAEDILQDVFYQFISSMRIEPIEKAASWLFHTAGNKIIDWYRKIKPSSLEGMSDSFPGGNVDKFLNDDRSGDDNDTLFLRSVMWEMLEDALEELPVKQREAFVMNELEGKSFREISEVTGDPINTLISRKRYAVTFLREKFRDIYDDLLD